MFKFLFRFIGLWLLAGAFVAFVIDGARSIGASRLVVMPLVDAWSAINASSIEALHQLIEKNFSAWMWESVALKFLNAPFWLVLGVLGTLLILIGRKRTYSVGYSSRD